jgi:hypothetical protein
LALAEERQRHDEHRPRHLASAADVVTAEHVDQHSAIQIQITQGV